MGGVRDGKDSSSPDKAESRPQRAPSGPPRLRTTEAPDFVEAHRQRATRLLGEGHAARAFGELVRASRSVPMTPRLAAVLVAFSLNLFGVFNVGTDGTALVEKVDASHGLGRSVGEGVLAVVLATPCSAPLLGTAVGFALSAGAFTVSELADFAVYTPLQRRGLVLAVLASSVVGLVVDSVLFLQLAFGGLDFLAGQVLGKAWMVLLSLPLMSWLRRRDERLGIQPA